LTPVRRGRSPHHLSREAGICRGQLGRAGERLNRIQCADGVLIGMHMRRERVGRYGVAFPFPLLRWTLPQAAICARLQGMWNPSCFKSLIRRVPARLRDHCQFLPFRPTAEGLPAERVLVRHRPFALQPPRQPRRPLFMPGSAEARVAVKAARFRAPVKNRRLCSSAPSGGPSARFGREPGLGSWTAIMGLYKR
jgi:hypothetical protein